MLQFKKIGTLISVDVVGAEVDYTYRSHFDRLKFTWVYQNGLETTHLVTVAINGSYFLLLPDAERDP